MFYVASFVDNAAALSIFVNGLSSVIQGDILIGTTWSQSNVCWFSNGSTVWRTVSGFPGDTWMDLRRSNPELSRGLSFALCGQSSDGERALEPTRCWRCSSVRVGARRSTATGSARWFLYPTNTCEPLLLTWVVLASARMNDI